MNPSVAWRTALFNATMDLEPELPPIVDACWLLTSTWLWTDSLESELSVPEPRLLGVEVEMISIINQPCVAFLKDFYRFKLLARLTIVATVRQYRAFANESLVMFDMLASQTDFINWPPRALWVRVVKPLRERNHFQDSWTRAKISKNYRNSACGDTPSRFAIEFSSASPLMSTSKL